MAASRQIRWPDLGAALKTLRQAKCLTQREVLGASDDTRYDPRWLRFLERGQLLPRRNVLLPLLVKGYCVGDVATVNRLLALAGYEPVSRNEIQALELCDAEPAPTTPEGGAPPPPAPEPPTPDGASDELVNRTFKPAPPPVPEPPTADGGAPPPPAPEPVPGRQSATMPAPRAPRAPRRRLRRAVPRAAGVAARGGGGGAAGAGPQSAPRPWSALWWVAGLAAFALGTVVAGTVFAVGTGTMLGLPPRAASRPGGVWLGPQRGAAVVGPIEFAARAYPGRRGDPPIDFVQFTVSWEGRPAGPWEIACRLWVPTDADVYRCTWDPATAGAPPGALRLSFDAYDQKGNVNEAPHGVRVVAYWPANPYAARRLWAAGAIGKGARGLGQDH
jgi:hypothetical protein